MSEKFPRPDYMTDEMLSYLDALRESGATNMMGAAPYLQAEFPELDKRQAEAITKHYLFGQG